ncbi:MAG: hypothetical protein B6D64_10290 [Bacteroidetes bacterium 4484_276]|nr:MAG: hypothetical protein B6D64_10290 [Bacteroidetes bacterium 4484_276]OYT11343.1 MAG: hypothetical protein B6I19_11605 [Bacteroidetes bacterium 4572_114]
MSLQGAEHRNIVQLGKYYGALHFHYSSGGFISTNITGALHLILKVGLSAIKECSEQSAI